MRQPAAACSLANRAFTLTTNLISARKHGRVVWDPCPLCLAAYTGFSKDACDIAAALSKSPPDFDTALTVFSIGKNSPSRRGGFRALGGE